MERRGEERNDKNLIQCKSRAGNGGTGQGRTTRES